MINCEAVAAASIEGRPSFSTFHNFFLFFLFSWISIRNFRRIHLNVRLLFIDILEILRREKFSFAAKFRGNFETRKIRANVGKLGNVELSFFFFFRMSHVNAYFSFHGKFKVIEIASHPESLEPRWDYIKIPCSLRVNFNGANEPAWF